ncbi:MAG: hypothetical protein JAZ05_16880 [Candidatus Thiodiazotropha taylori]|nr:hypothetical protein [Candidatus Thiodiazotropha taylori]
MIHPIDRRQLGMATIKTQFTTKSTHKSFQLSVRCQSLEEFHINPATIVFPTDDFKIEFEPVCLQPGKYTRFVNECLTWSSSWVIIPADKIKKGQDNVTDDRPLSHNI